MEYVHTLRPGEAKRILASSELPIEAVTNEVGYKDASFFGRLLSRKVNVTPAQYQNRFRGLCNALE